MVAPSIKVSKVEHFWNKIILTGCKWSSLNTPRSETPVSHSLLEISLFPFSAPAPSSLPLFGVIRNGLLWGAWQKGGNFLEQNHFYRLQIVQFECPNVRNPCVSSTFEDSTAWVTATCADKGLTYARARAHAWNLACGKINGTFLHQQSIDYQAQLNRRIFAVAT